MKEKTQRNAEMVLPAAFACICVSQEGRGVIKHTADAKSPENTDIESTTEGHRKPGSRMQVGEIDAGHLEFGFRVRETE